MSTTQNTLWGLGATSILALSFALGFMGYRGDYFPQKSFQSELGVYSTNSHENTDEILMVDQESIAFEQNMGQLDTTQGIQYYLEVDGVGCYLKPNGISYVWVREVSGEDSLSDKGNISEETDRKEVETTQIQLDWVGANPDPDIIATDKMTAVTNYYTGASPKEILGVPSFRKITYKNLYPHIDLVLYIQKGAVKYDFVVNPGGKVADIQLRYAGQDTLVLNADSTLTLDTRFGILTEGKPYTYQQTAAERVMVPSKFVKRDSLIGFEVGAYDTDKPLVIDPELMWATYYGGPFSEQGEAVCTDSKGNVYMVGTAFGYYHDLATPGAVKSFMGTDRDAFIVKFDVTGKRLWATYYGGAHNEEAKAVCTDKYGNVYLAGTTESDEGIAHFGHDNKYNQTTSSNNNRFHRDGFLVKFNTNGTRMWATYYGGEDGAGDEARAVACDANGNVYLAGLTFSKQDIAMGGHDNFHGGSADAFLAKFSFAGNRIWATYYGHLGYDAANAVAVDEWGYVYLAGYTGSGFGIAEGGHDDNYAGDFDAFLVRFNSDGDRDWGTYYGGTDVDMGNSLAVDGIHVYLSGITKSVGSIGSIGHDNTFNGGVDAFLVKFSFLGIRMWGTYYGGTEDEAISSSSENEPFRRSSYVAVSKLGDVYLAGPTESTTHIATNNGYKTSYDGYQDGYLVRFFPNGNRQWGTYYGGEGYENVRGVATDVSASVYIAGYTRSYNNIAQGGHDNLFDDTESSNHSDAFLAKLYPYGRPNFPPAPGGGVITTETRPDEDGPTHSDRLFSNSTSESIVLAPNPAIDKVEVAIPPNINTVDMLTLVDIQGKVVHRQGGLDNHETHILDLTNIPSGIYTVLLHTDLGILSEKLVVK